MSMQNGGSRSIRIACSANGFPRHLLTIRERKDHGLLITQKEGRHHGGIGDGSRPPEKVLISPDNVARSRHISVHPSRSSKGILIKRSIEVGDLDKFDYALFINNFVEDSLFPILVHRTLNLTLPQFDLDLRKEAIPCAHLGEIPNSLYSVIYCIVISGVDYKADNLYLHPLKFHRFNFSLFSVHVGWCCSTFMGLKFGTTIGAGSSSLRRNGVAVGEKRQIDLYPTSPDETHQQLQTYLHKLIDRTCEEIRVRNVPGFLLSRRPESILLF